MKPLIYSFLATVLFGLFIISCEKNNNEKQLIITGQLISNSTCKSDLKSTNQHIETSDSLSCVEYLFDKENNKLTLTHINAGFNCCPDRLYCKVELIGDIIQIQEFEKTDACRCECLFDLDIEINGIDQKTYQIKFVEPYISDQNKIVFELDFNKNTSGSYCVTRTQYPWGVASFSGAFYWIRDPVDSIAIYDMISNSGHWLTNTTETFYSQIPELSVKLDLPELPHLDQDENGFTSIEEWVSDLVRGLGIGGYVVKVALEETKGILLTVSAYPNPFSDYLTLIVKI